MYMWTVVSERMKEMGDREMCSSCVGMLKLGSKSMTMLKTMSHSTKSLDSLMLYP